MEKVKQEKGINLTGANQTLWVKQIFRTIIKLLITFFIILLIMFTYHYYKQNKTEKIQILKQHIEQKRQRISEIELKIEQLKQNHTLDKNNLLENKTIITFNHLIQKLPIKSGGISSIRFFNDKGLKIKIIGKYNEQQDFETLTQHLEKEGFHSKVEYLQTNEKSKTEFSLILSKE